LSSFIKIVGVIQAATLLQIVDLTPIGYCTCGSVISRIYTIIVQKHVIIQNDITLVHATRSISEASAGSTAGSGGACVRSSSKLPSTTASVSTWLEGVTRTILVGWVHDFIITIA